MKTADFLVLGGGIAGLSAASALARHGRVIVLEAEDAVGFHSSGRSATYYHFGIGNAPVRALTAFSRSFFERPPDDFAPEPLCRATPALFVARADMVEALHNLHAEMVKFTDTTAEISEAEMLRLFPPLKVGPDAVVGAVVDTGGRRLDADGLLQGYVRRVRGNGGEMLTGQRAARIARHADSWTVQTETGDSFSAGVLVNAAGAWADHVAELAGVRPLGLQPKRRTIIVFDAPSGTDVRDWPFVKAAVDDFYILPEAGRLMASPVDEIPSEPTDAQPEEYDTALAAWKVEEYTYLKVPRIAHKWAGLRSFVADRIPTAGFASDAPGFFWLAGQGGYGLQTAPAMAAICEALLCGMAWPQALMDSGVAARTVDPGRLAG